MSDRHLPRALALNAAVAAGYAATGWLGLQLPYYGEHVTLLWAPTAVALSAVVLAGTSLIPGIFLGSFALNVTLEPAYPLPAALIAAGNTLGPVVAGLVLVRRYSFRPQLDRVRDAFAFLGVGVLGTGLITATLGALWLCSFGDAPWRDYPAVWLAWIGGEAVGTLIAGPLLLTWLSDPDPSVIKPVRPVEMIAMVLALACFCVLIVVYGSRFVSMPYAFPLLFIWIVLRAGLREAFLAVTTVAVVLIVGTAQGVGPFFAATPGAGMLSLWMSIAAAGCATIIAGAVVVERDHALDHQRRLLAELDHRVKNTLATVAALAERSSEGAVDLDDFRSRFIGRIRAIARTHEGMARSRWRSMAVADVVAMTLAPFAAADSERLRAAGDEVALAPARVAPLTMVLYELATNAAKHGAWSRNGGRVTLAWTREDDQALRFEWRESGGPSTTSAPEPGYGLRLIEGLIGHQLGGRLAIDFGREGMTCRFHIAA